MLVCLAQLNGSESALSRKGEVLNHGPSGLLIYLLQLHPATDVTVTQQPKIKPSKETTPISTPQCPFIYSRAVNWTVCRCGMCLLHKAFPKELQPLFVQLCAFVCFNEWMILTYDPTQAILNPFEETRRRASQSGATKRRHEDKKWPRHRGKGHVLLGLQLIYSFFKLMSRKRREII